MQRRIVALTTIVLLGIIGCSSGGSSGGISEAYNAVYGVNAFSADENISLYVGDEVIETVMPYDQNASIVEKAVGSDNVVYYSVGTTGDYGYETLQNSRTYFYAATDCNDSIGKVDHLFHLVETDTQINIVNTSSDGFAAGDINISVDGVQVIIPDDIGVCGKTPVVMTSAKDQNISVSFLSGFTVSKVLPSDSSVNVVIYGNPPIEAAIIPLPRLTSDAL